MNLFRKRLRNRVQMKKNSLVKKILLSLPAYTIPHCRARRIDHVKLPGMRTDLRIYALIALGGFLGAVLRFLIDEQIPSLPGTLGVNFLGCIAMGMFMYESIYIGKFSRETRIFFGVGLISAFTTFSTLAVQSFASSPAVAVLNIAANLVLGLFGIFVGRYIITYQRGI